MTTRTLKTDVKSTFVLSSPFLTLEELKTLCIAYFPGNRKPTVDITNNVVQVTFPYNKSGKVVAARFNPRMCVKVKWMDIEQVAVADLARSIEDRFLDADSEEIPSKRFKYTICDDNSNGGNQRTSQSGDYKQLEDATGSS